MFLVLIKCLLGNYFAGKSLWSTAGGRAMNRRRWKWSKGFEIGSEDEFVCVVKEVERRRRNYD